MSKPSHVTAATAIYSRLSSDLVSTYASAVYRSIAPEGAMPGPSDKPLVVFDMEADYAATTFATDIAAIDIGVYVVRHADGSTTQADTVVGRIIGDGSTYGLHRWTPAIAGIGETPLRIVSSGEGNIDTEHAVQVLRFEAWLSEG
jgi:hypothetical protein